MFNDRVGNKVKLVAGLGLTGQSVLTYLTSQGEICVAFDTRKDFSTETLQALYPDLQIITGTLPKSFEKQVSQVVLSPGLSLKSSWLTPFLQAGIPVVGDIELFSRAVGQPIISITGSNGKSTVTSLVAELLTEAGYKVGMGGNIGLPALDMLNSGDDYDIFVLELSSFQLETTHSLHSTVATVLNICEDHMDRYDKITDYIQAKMTILHDAEWTLLPVDEAKNTIYQDKAKHLSFGLTSLKEDVPEPSHYFGIQTQQNEAWLCQSGECVMPVKEMALQGEHHQLNALAAMALTSPFQVSKADYQTVLKQFKGLPHRTQTVLVQEGVEWVNDSKGTNVGATLTAINSLAKQATGKIILLAGGVGKEADFSALAPAVSQYCKQVVLFGRDADLIYQHLQQTSQHDTALMKVAGLEEAIMAAHQAAEEGDIILFSPACASFDQFTNYIKRGEIFEQLVHQHIGQVEHVC